MSCINRSVHDQDHQLARRRQRRLGQVGMLGLTICAVLLLAGCSLGATSAAPTPTATELPSTPSPTPLPSLKAALAGTSEVPPNSKGGKGTALVTIDTSKKQLCYALTVTSIKLPALQAHIHKGATGVNGAIVVTLNPPLAATPTAGTPTPPPNTTYGAVSGCVPNVDAALLQDLLAHPANYYVNVHTTDFPNGAVRGQLSLSA
jgi:hypothetical protein